MPDPTTPPDELFTVNISADQPGWAAILSSLVAYVSVHGSTRGWTWDCNPTPPIVPPGAWGIDISGWQPTVNWVQVKADGVQFAFIKASEGLAVDSTFASHWAGAASVLIPRGAYHYFRQESDAAVQAAVFANAVGASELGLVVDIEAQFAKIPQADFVQRLLTFLGVIERLSGKKPMIYTGKYIWADLTGNPSWAADYPLWIAQYPFGNVIPPISTVRGMTPDLPIGWKTYAYWQYSSAGRVPGITGNVDYDISCPVAVPTPAPTPVPTPAPAPTPTPKPNYKVNVSSASLFSGPSTSDSVLGYAKMGDLLVGTSIQNGLLGTDRGWIRSFQVALL